MVTATHRLDRKGFTFSVHSSPHHLIYHQTLLILSNPVQAHDFTSNQYPTQGNLTTSVWISQAMRSGEGVRLPSQSQLVLNGEVERRGEKSQYPPTKNVQYAAPTAVRHHSFLCGRQQLCPVPYGIVWLFTVSVSSFVAASQMLLCSHWLFCLRAAAPELSLCESSGIHNSNVSASLCVSHF